MKKRESIGFTSLNYKDFKVFPVRYSLYRPFSILSQTGKASRKQEHEYIMTYEQGAQTKIDK